MIEKAVIDAQVLFYFHYDYEKVPPLLQQLKKKIINGEITIILPTIAISELLWKCVLAPESFEKRGLLCFRYIGIAPKYRN